MEMAPRQCSAIRISHLEHPMFDWKKIDTVLLDMDGTLLDLHFDNHFWLSLVPQELSKQRGLSQSQAQQWVEEAYGRVAGILGWYCLDYEQKQVSD